MAKINYSYFECHEEDCPMIGEDGLPCVIQIAEGERRRCPCERKIKLKDERIVPPPRPTGGLNLKALMIAGGLLIVVLFIVWINIRPPKIDIAPTQIAFGPSPIDSSRTKSVMVKNTGHGKLRLISASFDSDGASVFQVTDEEAKVLKAGDSKKIEITFKPADGGPFEETLTIRSNDKKSGDQTITVTGSVAVELEEALEKAFSPLDATSTILK